jgi:hypothetical protein
MGRETLAEVYFLLSPLLVCATQAPECELNGSELRPSISGLLGGAAGSNLPTDGEFPDESDMHKSLKPNLFIIGAMKSGTSLFMEVARPSSVDLHV